MNQDEAIKVFNKAVYTALDRGHGEIAEIIMETGINFKMEEDKQLSSLLAAASRWEKLNLLNLC